MKYEDGSVPAKIASSLHDQHIEVERLIIRSRNSPGDVLLKCAMPIVVILAPLVEVSASHVQVKVKNEFGCYVYCRFFEIRQPRRG
jgi:hypothetical protein